MRQLRFSVYMGLLAIFVLPLFANGIAVNEQGSFYTCNGGVTGDVDNTDNQIYIRPTSNNNPLSDTIPDEEISWVCNNSASDVDVSGTPSAYYAPIVFASSSVDYYFDDDRALFTPFTAGTGFASSDFIEVTDAIFSPLANTRHGITSTDVHRNVESEDFILLQEPRDVEDRHAVISCHITANQYYYAVAFPGATTINFSNVTPVVAGNDMLNQPAFGPVSATLLTNIPGTISSESCEHYELHWCGDGVVDTGSFTNLAGIDEQCDPADEAGGVDVFASAFQGGGYTCTSQCQAVAVGAPSCIINAVPNPVSAGNSTTISWSGFNATGAEFEVNYPSGTPTPVGIMSSSVEFPVTDTTYAVTVYGGGTSTVCQIDVTVDPNVNLLKEQSSDGVIFNSFAPGNPMYVQSGDTITYRITYQNASLVAATSLTITDNDLVDEPGLSCDYAGFGFTGPTPSFNGSSVNPQWTITSLPAATAGTISFTCDVISNDLGVTSPGEFVNNANMVGSNIPFTQSNYVAATVADLNIEKFQATGWDIGNTINYGVLGTETIVNPLVVNSGDTMYYRIRVQNNGGLLTGVDISDTIPPGLGNCTGLLLFSSNGSATITPSGLWGSPNWNVDIFDANDVVQIVFACDILFPTLAPFTNSALVTVPGVIDPGLPSNEVSATVLSMFLRKYQATGYNAGGDPYGALINNIQGQLQTGAMNVAGVSRIYYRLNVINNGGTMSGLTIIDVLNPALTGCQVEAAWQNTTDITSFTNIAGGILTMQFPSGTSFDGADDINVIYSCAIPVPNLTNQYTNDFTAEVSWGLSNTQQFTSNRVLAEIPELFVDKWQRNVSTDVPTLGAYTTGPVLFSTGDVFSFILNYGNFSSGVMNDVTLVDTFPTGFILNSVSLTGAGLTCDGGPFVAAQSYTSCTWNLGQLLVGQTGQIIMTGQMANGATGFYYNTGQIFNDSELFDTAVVQQIPNFVPGGPTLNIEKRQVSAANSGFNDATCDPISCTATTNPITVQNNYWMRYEITVTNNGTGPALNVQVYDFFPDGFVPQGTPSVVGTVPGYCDPFSGPTISGNFLVNCYASQALPQGGSITFIIDGYVLTNASGLGGPSSISQYVNTANVISTNDPNCVIIGDCTSTVIATIPGTPILDIEKTFLSATAEPGDLVDFTLQYRNIGSVGSLATGLTLTDFLPAGLIYVSHVPNTIPFVGGVFDINVAHPFGLPVTAGYAGFITVTAQVDTGYAGTGIVNTGTICASNAPSCADDDAVLSILVTTGIDIVKTAQQNGAPISGVAAGSVFTYVLDFVNNGNGSLINYEITDFLPPTVTFLNGTAQASLNGNPFVLAAPGQTVTATGVDLTWTCLNNVSSSLPSPCAIAAGGTGQIMFDVIVN